MASVPALIATVCPAPPKVFVPVNVNAPVPAFAIVPAPLMTPEKFESRLFEAPTVRTLPVPTLTVPAPFNCPIVSE